MAVPNTAKAGNYNVTIVSTSGSLTHNTTLILTVPVTGITGFSVSNVGSGYTTATARVSQGRIFALLLTNAGTGYTSAPTVSFRDPNPRAKGAVATAIFQ